MNNFGYLQKMSIDYWPVYLLLVYCNSYIKGTVLQMLVLQISCKFRIWEHQLKWSSFCGRGFESSSSHLKQHNSSLLRWFTTGTTKEKSYRKFKKIHDNPNIYSNFKKTYQNNNEYFTSISTIFYEFLKFCKLIQVTSKYKKPVKYLSNITEG